jgi:N-acetylglucosaminyl-diphospho-decaprenol L-rhamnosyltransferase
MHRHPEAGALGAKQIGPHGDVQQSIRGFPTASGILKDILKLKNDYRLNDFDYEREQPAPQPMGTFLLFRKEALPDPKKPFDERFPIFFNEVDLLYRMHKAGWPAIYSPEVAIRHHGGESTKQVKKSMIWESHRSLMRFLNKHYRTPWNAIGLELLALLVFIGAFVRAKGYHAGFRA